MLSHEWYRRVFRNPMRRRKMGRVGPAAATVQCLENRTLLAAAFAEFVDPNPSADNGFGSEVIPLSTGNVVVTAPYDDAGGTDAGAVYLFNGATGELISTLTGSQDFDLIGRVDAEKNSVVALTNGNFLVVSPRWSNGNAAGVGAVTFGSGTTGVSGFVSQENSLIGNSAGDRLGRNGVIIPLPNGDYVVSNPNTSNGGVSDVGSITHGDGDNGTTGVVSVANSLVGTRRGDSASEILVLANGDYVVLRPSWDSPTVQDAGAVTRINGDTGLIGFVDATNSLVGPRTATFRGATLTELTNGNFVIAQPNWTDDEGTTIGAATLIDSSGEATGVFDASTSLVGSSEDDFEDVVVTPLSNGNYVVETPFWDDETLVNAAAVTWQSGTTAVGAEVSPAISVISAIFGAALDNGNVVLVRSTTFGFFDGTTGFSGTLSDSNSLGFHRSGRLPTFQMLPNGKIAVAFNVPDDGMGFDDGAFWIGEPVVGVNGEITPDNSVFGIPATFDGPGFSVVVLPNSNLVFEVLGNNTNSVYFANGTALQTGTYAEDDGIFANSAYGLLTGNFVVEGRRTNGEYFIELIDGSTGPSEQTPSSVSIAGRFSVALGNGNFAVRSGQDIVIGDGSTRGVVATATPGVLGAGRLGARRRVHHPAPRGTGHLLPRG